MFNVSLFINVPALSFNPITSILSEIDNNWQESQDDCEYIKSRNFSFDIYAGSKVCFTLNYAGIRWTFFSHTNQSYAGVTNYSVVQEYDK